MVSPRHKRAPIASAPRPTADRLAHRSSTARILDQVTWLVIVGGVILIPLWVSPTGEDSFRYPKELLFRGQAIVLIALLALYLILVPREFPLRDIPCTLWILVSAITCWTAITTLSSTNVALSARSFVWLIACVVTFLCTYAQLRLRSTETIWIAILPAIINAAVAVLQWQDIWHPVDTISPFERGEVVGLMGNPNDVASLLVVPLLVVAAFASFGQRRIAAFVTATLLAFGIVATATLTAIVAALVGMLVLAFSVRRRAGLLVMLCLTVAFTALISVDGPIRKRMEWKLEQFAQRKYEWSFSHRLGASLIAAEIIRDHPFLGSGPGTFGWNYYEYRLQIVRKYTDLLDVRDPQKRVTSNFGEVHNDHLEIAAETGVPGFLLFITFLAWLFRTASRSSVDSVRRITPAATAGFVVSAAGLFPLQLAATTTVLIFLSAYVSAHDLNPPSSLTPFKASPL